MLSSAQHDAFERTGVLRLPGAIPGPAVDGMRNRLWRHLEETYGMTPQRPDTWSAGVLAHFQGLIRTGAFDPMATAQIRGSVAALLGQEGWRQPEHWGRPLVTLPERDAPWRLPISGWHMDSSGRPGDPLLVVFACLATVRPRGGGTLVVTGSHRLARAGGRYAGLRSADVRTRLACDHPWFRDLFSPGPEPDRTTRLGGSAVVVDGVRLRIEELTGKPGDAFLVDPRLLHAVAPNTLDTPRLMLLQFLEPSPG
jgi:Phytanoyl-CoA dioxygenase (PhyH)